MEKVWNMQCFYLDIRKTPEDIKRQLYSFLNKLGFSHSSFTWSSILYINQYIVCSFRVMNWSISHLVLWMVGGRIGRSIRRTMANCEGLVHVANLILLMVIYISQTFLSPK